MTNTRKYLLIAAMTLFFVVAIALLATAPTAMAQSGDSEDYYWEMDGNKIENNTLILKRGYSSGELSLWVNGNKIIGEVATVEQTIASKYFTVSDDKVITSPNTPLSMNEATTPYVVWTDIYGASYLQMKLNIQIIPEYAPHITITDATSYMFNVVGADMATDDNGNYFEKVEVQIKETNIVDGIEYTYVKLTDNTNKYNNRIYNPGGFFNSGKIGLQLCSMTYTDSQGSYTYTPEDFPYLFNNKTEYLTGYFAGGSGAIYDPYQISNERELKNIAQFHAYIGSQEAHNGNYKLVSDITLTGEWTPIPYAFIGNFDGNGKTIYNMKVVARAVDFAGFGLFSKIDYGSVKNLNIANASITCPTTSGSAAIDVGLIAGSNAGTISNCTVQGNIDVQLYKADVGGIAGVNSGKITGCINDSSSVIAGSGNIGGIAGVVTMSFSEISDCKNYGTIKYYFNTENGTAAGIVGKSILSANVKDCNNYGQIEYASNKKIKLSLAPCISQIIGWNESGETPVNCAVTPQRVNLQKLYSYQKKYANDGIVGLTGEK